MNVLLSIKPEFVERIFSGEKKFEYRKAIFKRNDIKKIVIYSTMPEGKIVGEFSIEKIHNNSPELIWKQTKKRSGIKKSFFDSYFFGRHKAYAIEIADVVRYDTPIKLSQLAKKVSAPQSFSYLHDDIFLEIA
ncbi:ASCH domain-containing protein [Marinomonas ostreistagni]|uniref:ASCH domain-containing protein n=1 Tax=Marinomonas ostreistagni TaxID=359209 RepID=UPI00194DC90C|nr:ASCH domain-containing protein [Marinomonas ostreistagni]MBM6550308.1 ASCH domain-containing protein [Marinomonas ostreistagni]